MDFFDIFRGFGLWIRELFSSPEKINILLSNRTRYGTADLIECSEPGVIDWSSPKDVDPSPKFGIWRLNHFSSDYYCLVCLLNVAQLKEELGNRFYAKNEQWRRLLSETARKNLAEQEKIAASHMLLIIWVEKSVKYPKIFLQSCILCDLQGASESWTSKNSVAKNILREVIKRVMLRMWHPEMSHSWSEAVKQINWTQWLEVYSQQYLGREHVLQPIKSHHPHPRHL